MAVHGCMICSTCRKACPLCGTCACKGTKITPDYPNQGIFYRPNDESQTVEVKVIGNHLLIRLSGYGGVSFNKKEAAVVFPVLKEWLEK